MNEAIRQAGQLARDHHRRTGTAVTVEIASREGTTLLSRYTGLQPQPDTSAADQLAAEQEVAQIEAALQDAATASGRESAAA
jgi:hypothetical protein